MLTMSPKQLRVELYKRMASQEPTRVVGRDGTVAYLLPERMVDDAVKTKAKSKGLK